MAKNGENAKNEPRKTRVGLRLPFALARHGLAPVLPAREGDAPRVRADDDTVFFL